MKGIINQWVRQMVFSRATFGPGARSEGVCAHINEELGEVLAAATLEKRIDEWVDVNILAIDGLTRQLRAMNPQMPLEEVARYALARIQVKRLENEARVWPAWQDADPDRPINHDRRHDT